MVYGRKRVYGGRSASKRSFKKRRFTPRRKSFKSRSYSSKNATGSGFIRYGGRKLGRRAWKRSLFTHSRHLTHYRSTGQESNTVHSSVNALNYLTNILDAIDVTGSGYEFWQTVGGLQPHDNLAYTDPAFQGNIILRGGTVSLRFFNAGITSSPVNLFVILFKVRKGNSQHDTWTADTAKGIGWDPSMEPDFSARFGTIIFSMKKSLSPGDTFQVDRKLPCQEVDQEVYRDTKLYKWMIGLNDPMGDGINVPIVRTFNLSFSGDATVLSVPE